MKQYVKDLKDHDTKAVRIQGLKKLVTVGLRTPWPIKVITHQGFLDFKKQQGRLSKDLKQQIIAAFREIRKKNPKRGVYAGRAYYVPGIDNPPGPRSSSVHKEEVILREVKKLYIFAIESKYDQNDDAEIGVIFYPFINAGDPIPDPSQPELQFPGGCVSLSEQNTAVIEVLFGADEGVQSFPFDTYVVDLTKMKIISQNIASKTKSLRATSDLTYETVDVPAEFRDQPTLTNEVVVEIGRDFNKLVERFGPHRLEFILQPEGVVFRECVPFKREKEVLVSAEGKVRVIKTSKDVAKLFRETQMVFVHPSVITKRDMDLLTELAFEAPHELVILFPGSASTAHAATLLRERGHKVVYVGQEIFKPGEKILLKEGKFIRR